MRSNAPRRRTSRSTRANKKSAITQHARCNPRQESNHPLDFRLVFSITLIAPSEFSPGVADQLPKMACAGNGH